MASKRPDLRVRVRQALPGETEEYFTASARARAQEDLAEREREQAERRKRSQEENDVTIPGLRVLHS